MAGGTADDLVKRVQALNARAWSLRLDQPDHAMALARRAVMLARRGADGKLARQGWARALAVVAWVKLDRGQYACAARRAMCALRLIEDQGASETEVSASCVMVWVYGHAAEHGKALEIALRALRLCRTLKDRSWEGRLLDALGCQHQRCGHADSAAQAYHRALAIADDIGDATGGVTTRLNLVETLLGQSRWQEALVLAGQSADLVVARQLGWRHQVMAALRLAQALRQAGRADLALIELESAKARHPEGEAPAVLIELLISLAGAQAHASQLVAALATSRRALCLARRIGHVEFQIRSHQQMSALLEQAGRPGAALVHFKHFHALQQDLRRQESARRVDLLRVTHRLDQVLAA